MDFIPFHLQHAREAGLLLDSAYRKERGAVPVLPKSPGPDAFADMAATLAGNGLGIAAVEGGRLMGFLTGMAAGPLFGTSRGVYVPVYGHGASCGDRGLLYHQLYAAAAKAWVDQGLLSHVITMYAHDSAAVNTWFHLDFGMRCVDSVRPLTPVSGAQPGFDVRQVMPEDADALQDLHGEHHLYYRSAPMFMPAALGSLPANLRGWLLEKEGRHVFAAFEGSRPVAYMQLAHGGETFASDDEKSMNICGAFVAAGQRRAGYGAAILQAIVDWLGAGGFARLGVDYESFNLYGSRFWEKHFTCFTVSLTRRIDERIVQQG